MQDMAGVQQISFNSMLDTMTRFALYMESNKVASPASPHLNFTIYLDSPHPSGMGQRKEDQIAHPLIGML